jgi:hypothetical protein
MFPQRKKRGALGLLGGRQGLPFRAADGPEENCVGRGARLERRFWKRGAVAVDGNASDVGFNVVELELFLSGDVVEDSKGLGHDLGPNSVSAEYCKLEWWHVKIGMVLNPLPGAARI